MSRRRTIRRSVTIMIVIALAPWLMPAAWTARLSAVGQILVPLQDAAAAGAALATGVVADATSAPQTAEVYLRNQIAALAVRVAELERENNMLAATPRSAHTGGRLIRARVIGQDTAPWRATRRISAGSLGGVQVGDAVVSRHFSIAAGADDGVAPGYAVLLGEALVGFVDQAHAVSARVQWVSDARTAMNVRVGRHTEAGFVIAPGEFWLTGSTSGRIELRDISNEDVESGVIAAGDTVLVAQPTATLPAPLTIGTVASIELDRANPLLSIARVESPVALPLLHTVYVYSPNP